MQADTDIAVKSKFITDLLKETTPLSYADIQCMSNWVRISHRLAHNAKDHQIVLSMLAYELDNAQRSQVIDRLVSRFTSIIKTKVQDDLMKYIMNNYSFRRPFREA